MKLVGLIGGTSWHSSAAYYRRLNELVHQRLGGHHSMRCILWSLDFDEIVRNNESGRHDLTAETLLDAANGLCRAGVSGIALCSNGTHQHAEALRGSVPVPMVHIADAVAAQIQAARLKTVGLLGTRFTMEMGFYQDVLVTHGLEVVVPPPSDRQAVHDAIFTELTHGLFLPETRDRFCDLIGDLRASGAEGVVLGCTEIPLLLESVVSEVPLFDTTEIHCRAIVEFALSDEPGT